MGMDIFMGTLSLFLGPSVNLALSTVGTSLDMEPEQRVKYVLEEGDVNFAVSYKGTVMKQSFFKRDGSFICAVLKDVETDKETVLVNPDIIPKDGKTIMKDNWVPFPINLFLS